MVNLSQIAGTATKTLVASDKMKLMDENQNQKDEIYEQLIKEKSEEFFCDNCGYYPIEPVHGHFVCPACHMPTKCCEGLPAA